MGTTLEHAFQVLIAEIYSCVVDCLYLTSYCGGTANIIS